MTCYIIQTFLLVILLFNGIQCVEIKPTTSSIAVTALRLHHGGTKICDYTDVKCITKAANNFAKRSKKFPGLNSACKDNIEGETEGLKYKMTNATLSGFSDCEVTKFVLDLIKFTYEYYMHCPQLYMTSSFEMNGTLASLEANGEGTFNVTYENYNLIYRGKNMLITDKKDKKRKLIGKTFNLEHDPQGNITLDFEIVCGDQEKFDEVRNCLNENSKEMETYIRKPIMNVLLNVYAHKFAAFFGTYPIDDILTVEQKRSRPSAPARPLLHIDLPKKVLAGFKL